MPKTIDCLAVVRASSKLPAPTDRETIATVPMLMALDAQVCINGNGGEKIIPIKDFFRDDVRA